MNSEEHDPEDLLGLHPFERLADEFVLKLRRGQSVDIEQIAAEHPEHAEMIRSVFPSLVVVERVSAQDATRSFSPNTEISPPSLSGHPQAFGDFEIVRRIGMGGMGVVYEAIQRSLQRRVALKVIHLQISNEQRLKVRFRREAEAAAGLHHTNIVPVFGNGEDHGLEYYAMQLIDGVTLAQVIGSIRSQHKGSSKDRSDNRTIQTSPSWDIDSDAIIAAERLLQDPKHARAMVSQSEQAPAQIGRAHV